MLPLASGLLSPNPGLFFWTFVVFVLLLFILSKFAWRPITASLGERERTIDESIRRAENALAEARQLQADNEAARRDAEAQARKLLSDANEAADRVRADRKVELDAELAARRQQAEAELDRQQPDAPRRTPQRSGRPRHAGRRARAPPEGGRARSSAASWTTSSPRCRRTERMVNGQQPMVNGQCSTGKPPASHSSLTIGH